MDFVGVQHILSPRHCSLCFGFQVSDVGKTQVLTFAGSVWTAVLSERYELTLTWTGYYTPYIGVSVGNRENSGGQRVRYMLLSTCTVCTRVSTYEYSQPQRLEAMCMKISVKLQSAALAMLSSYITYMSKIKNRGRSNPSRNLLILRTLKTSVSGSVDPFKAPDRRSLSGSDR